MEHSNLMGCGIYLSLSVYLYETEANVRPSSATADLDAEKDRILKAPLAVLLNKCRVLSRNFTELSLSSKTQCHVNRTVTEGPAFVSCCLIMGEGYHRGLGITLEHNVLAQPSIVCNHYCLSVNLKYVTCGRLLSVLARTCRLVNLTD